MCNQTIFAIKPWDVRSGQICQNLFRTENFQLFDRSRHLEFVFHIGSSMVPVPFDLQFNPFCAGKPKLIVILQLKKQEIIYLTKKIWILQIDNKQLNKILGYIKSGIDSGATLVTGGERAGTKGFYVQPTVFSDVKVYLYKIPCTFFFLKFISEIISSFYKPITCSLFLPKR